MSFSVCTVVFFCFFFLSSGKWIRFSSSWTTCMGKTLTPHLSLQSFSQPKGRQVDHSKAFWRRVEAVIYMYHTTWHLWCFHMLSPFILATLYVRDCDSQDRAKERKCLIYLLIVPLPASYGAGALIHICWTPETGLPRLPLLWNHLVQRRNAVERGLIREWRPELKFQHSHLQLCGFKQVSTVLGL